MNSKPLEIEGTWEEIMARKKELAGRKVRLTVLSDSSELPYPEKTPYFLPASGRFILRHAGTWQGDDFEECLSLVYETRSELEF